MRYGSSLLRFTVLAAASIFLGTPSLAERSLTNPVIDFNTGSEAQQLVDRASSLLVESSCILLHAIESIDLDSENGGEASQELLQKAKEQYAEATRLLDEAVAKAGEGVRVGNSEPVPQQFVQRSWFLLELYIQPGVRDSVSTSTDLLKVLASFVSQRNAELQEIDSLVPPDGGSRSELISLSLGRQSVVAEVARSTVAVIEACGTILYFLNFQSL